MWDVGSWLLTAGMVVLATAMFLGMFIWIAPESLCKPPRRSLLSDYLSEYQLLTYHRCQNRVKITGMLISPVLMILVIRAVFYYRIYKQIEPPMRRFFQWLTKEKEEVS